MQLLISLSGFLVPISLSPSLHFPSPGLIDGQDEVFKGQSQGSRPIEHKAATNDNSGSLFLQLSSTHGKQLPRFFDLPRAVHRYLVQYLKQQDS